MCDSPALTTTSHFLAQKKLLKSVWSSHVPFSLAFAHCFPSPHPKPQAFYLLESDLGSTLFGNFSNHEALLTILLHFLNFTA